MLAMNVSIPNVMVAGSYAVSIVGGSSTYVIRMTMNTLRSARSTADDTTVRAVRCQPFNGHI